MDSSPSFQGSNDQEETSPLRGGEEEQEGAGKGPLKTATQLVFNAADSEM